MFDDYCDDIQRRRQVVALLLALRDHQGLNSRRSRFLSSVATLVSCQPGTIIYQDKKLYTIRDKSTFKEFMCNNIQTVYGMTDEDYNWNIVLDFCSKMYHCGQVRDYSSTKQGFQNQ